jgi:hypothetical protein
MKNPIRPISVQKRRNTLFFELKFPDISFPISLAKIILFFSKDKVLSKLTERDKKIIYLLYNNPQELDNNFYSVFESMPGLVSHLKSIGIITDINKKYSKTGAPVVSFTRKGYILATFINLAYNSKYESYCSKYVLKNSILLEDKVRILFLWLGGVV